MPRTNLTDAAIRSLQPPESGTTMLWDSMKNFGVRCSPGGTKSFVVLLGSGRRHTIGRYPVVTLAAAREEARQLLAERTLGKYRPKRVTAKRAANEFLDDLNVRPRTKGDYTYYLDRLAFSGSIADITPYDVARRLDRLKHTPSMYTHAFYVARAFFNWCVSRHYVDHSPLQRMRTPAPYRKRDRVLSAGELAAIWSAAGEIGWTYGTLVRLLITTGQRRGEIANLLWDWIDRSDASITFPPSITKNGKRHVLPYGELTSALLETVPRAGALLFPARGNSGASFSGWSKSKARLDTLAGVSDWVLHDLRRAYATNLAALGTPIHVTEKLLNHISGSHAGIVGVYQRHSYQREMREAQEAHERALSAFVNPN